MSKKPPSARAHVQFFLDLVEEYDALCEAFPVEQKSFTMPVKDEAQRWARLVRAFALRKFTLATDDEAYVATVLDRLADLGAENGTSIEVEGYKANFRKVINGGTAFGDGKGGTVKADAIIREYLYGGYLHGDYDRWMSAKTKSGLFDGMALWTWTRGSEDCIHNVVRLIRECEAHGAIDLAGPPAD